MENTSPSEKKKKSGGGAQVSQLVRRPHVSLGQIIFQQQERSPLQPGSLPLNFSFTGQYALVKISSLC